MNETAQWFCRTVKTGMLTSFAGILTYGLMDRGWSALFGYLLLFWVIGITVELVIWLLGRAMTGLSWLMFDPENRL